MVHNIKEVSDGTNNALFISWVYVCQGKINQRQSDAENLQSDIRRAYALLSIKTCRLRGRCISYHAGLEGV
jgi:hypothetical protein